MMQKNTYRAEPTKARRDKLLIRQNSNAMTVRVVIINISIHNTSQVRCLDKEKKTLSMQAPLSL